MGIIKKVLIIEDELKDFNKVSKDIRDNIIEVIPSTDEEFQSMCISLQTNSNSYIEQLIKDNYLTLRCIVCDIHLFDKHSEGARLISLIRDIKIPYCEDYAKYIPIIIYTNYSDEHVTESALYAGGDFYISKNSDRFFSRVVKRECERFDYLCDKFIISNRARNIRPKVFVGSSSKRIKIAEYIANKLKRISDAISWSSEDAFPLGNTTLERLEQIVNEYDYGVFIFNKDDELIMNNQVIPITRDNVILEFGMFLGKYGRKRTFFVVPQAESNDSKIHLASDLAGLQYATYNPNEPDLNKALKDACKNLKKVIK